MRKVLTGIALTLTLAMTSPAPAAVNVAVAVPGSFLAGYATPVLVLSKSAPATFVNLDAFEHDIRAVLKGSDGEPLFSSAIIGTGQTAPIEGLAATPDGTYDYFCVLHESSMRGTAVVTA